MSMVRKGNLAVFESINISETRIAMPTKIGVHALDINTYLYNFFWADSNRFNFLMTLDYSPWSERKIWPFLKGSNISKTGETTPTKNGEHELDINPYLHEFFEPIPID